jgi:hypothetical protein
MALLYTFWYSTGLPMQWTKPMSWLKTSKGRGASTEEVYRSPSSDTYLWLLPYHIIGGTNLTPEPCRPNFHRYLLTLQMASVWGISFLYPMDWDQWFQEWPLPTVYAALSSFLLCQLIALLEESVGPYYICEAKSQ